MGFSRQFNRQARGSQDPGFKLSLCERTYYVHRYQKSELWSLLPILIRFMIIWNACIFVFRYSILRDLQCMMHSTCSNICLVLAADKIRDFVWTKNPA